MVSASRLLLALAGSAAICVFAAAVPQRSVLEYEWTTQLQDPTGGQSSPGLSGEDAGLRCRVAVSTPQPNVHAFSVRSCIWLRAAPGGELLPVGASAEEVPIDTDYHEPFIVETSANGSLSHVWHAGEGRSSLNK